MQNMFAQVKKWIHISGCFFCVCCALSWPVCCCAEEKMLYWWRPGDSTENFGDELSRVVVEKMLGHPVKRGTLDAKGPLLLAVGSIILHARDGDTIWGSGIRENPLTVEKRFRQLDVRAVRGPRSREFLCKQGIKCPEIYGDPALLIPYLFPHLKRAKQPTYDYIILPNRGEIDGFLPYKNVVMPTRPWNEIVQIILQSKLVISSSLHGIILAEAFGIPARLLKMTWIEELIKYQDYYESTGRSQFRYATSVASALQMGGESPGSFDIQPLLKSFPWDYFGKRKPERTVP